MTNVDNMSDDEFAKWMQEQENGAYDEEEIEVGGTEATEEVADDLEQPDEDSDDNGDNEEVDEDTEDDSEDDEGDADESTEELTEEQPDEVDEDANTEAQPVEQVAEVKTYKYKAKGQEFEFTEDEIKAQFGDVFAKAMDYTQKTQAIKPYRKMIDAMEQEKITPEDMNFAIDLLKGNKEAITTLLQRHKVDALELEVESKPNYTPNNYGRSDAEISIAEVAARINKDPEYDITHNVVTNEWDEDSWAELSKKPALIEIVHKDVKSGAYQRIDPIAKKLRLQDEIKYGTKLRSDFEYYKQAVSIDSDNINRRQALAMQQQEAEATQQRLTAVKTTQVKKEAVQYAATGRRAAAPTKSKAGTKKLTDYLNEDFDKMSDEDYTKWIEGKLK